MDRHSASFRQDFMKLRQNYWGLSLCNELNFDTELVSTIIAKIKERQSCRFSWHNSITSLILPSQFVSHSKQTIQINLYTYVPVSTIT